jgi:hypothetical protein
LALAVAMVNISCYKNTTVGYELFACRLSITDDDNWASAGIVFYAKHNIFDKKVVNR